MKFIQRTGVFWCLVAACIGLKAQVVVDGSFGNAGALSGPNFKIPDTLGKTVGDNLFHSFSEFSLQTGQAATFTGPDTIQNILGRVTGDKVSEIDGLIRSEITDANLYLLNPNGFLFGKNARGDIEIESAGEVRLAKSELTASAAKDGGSIRLLGTGERSIRDRTEGTS